MLWVIFFHFFDTTIQILILSLHRQPEGYQPRQRTRDLKGDAAECQPIALAA